MGVVCACMYLCVCVLYCTFINNQRTRVFQSWIFPLPPPCSSVKKCKQISWMFFIVIYLFHVIFFFSFSFFSTFLFFSFLCNATSAIALSVAVVSGNCFMCVIWVCECVCVWESERACVWVCVCMSVPIVFMWNKQFLRASLKFLETRPLRMFSNYKQFQCSSSASGKLLLLLLLFFIVFVYCFVFVFVFFLHCQTKVTPSAQSIITG